MYWVILVIAVSDTMNASFEVLESLELCKWHETRECKVRLLRDSASTRRSFSSKHYWTIIRGATDIIVQAYEAKSTLDFIGNLFHYSN
jgi:hypothetical protein